MGGGIKKDKPYGIPGRILWVCPQCDGAIRWSCGSTGHGYAYCEFGSAATRMFEPGAGKHAKTCDWEGYCERRPDGKVEIYYY